MVRAKWVVAVGVAILAAGPAMAQSKGVELGLDGGFTAKLNDTKVTTLSIPVQRLRVGFMASDKVEVEPAVAVNWLKVSGADALTTLSAEMGVLLHFATDVAKSRPYVRPFAGLEHFTSGGDGSTVFQAGAGIGVKVPVQSVAKFAIRLEAGYTHGFKKEGDGIPASENLHFLVGFSLFTR